MSRVASFDEFRKSRTENTEKPEVEISESSDENSGYYMFFRNLMSMKHYIDEILAMDPAKVEEMLSNGHDWASDHITSAKDDVAEVAEWIRTESEMIDGDGSEEEEVEVKTEVEDSDDDSDEDEEEEESETEDEEEERESL